MRKMLILIAIAATVVVWTASSASATVHPLVCSENSSAPAWTPAQTQDPPGITPGGPDQGKAGVAQPIEAILGNSTLNDFNAFKGEGCP